MSSKRSKVTSVTFLGESASSFKVYIVKIRPHDFAAGNDKQKRRGRKGKVHKVTSTLFQQYWEQIPLYRFPQKLASKSVTYHSLQFWFQYFLGVSDLHGVKISFSHLSVIVASVLPLPRSLWCDCEAHSHTPRRHTSKLRTSTHSCASLDVCRRTVTVRHCTCKLYANYMQVSQHDGRWCSRSRYILQPTSVISGHNLHIYYVTKYATNYIRKIISTVKFVNRSTLYLR